MSNISEFYSKLKETSFRHAHEFQVTLSGAGGGNLDNDIKFFAQAAKLPGLTISESEVKFQGLGFVLPGIVTYEHEYDFEVLCDTNMNTYEDVKAWMARFSNLAMSTGGDKRVPDTKIYLDLLDTTLSSTVRQYEMIGVWPASISALDFSHEGAAEPMKFTLGLKYQYFIESGKGDPLQDGDGSSTAETISSYIDKGSAIVNALRG